MRGIKRERGGYICDSDFPPSFPLLSLQPAPSPFAHFTLWTVIVSSKQCLITNKIWTSHQTALSLFFFPPLTCQFRMSTVHLNV